MNIGFLRETFASITQVKPLGGTFEINEVLYHLVGLVRYGDALKLAVLHYDENFAEEAELYEELEGFEEYKAVEGYEGYEGFEGLEKSERYKGDGESEEF